jgi:hypothetical protein
MSVADRGAVSKVERPAAIPSLQIAAIASQSALNASRTSLGRCRRSSQLVQERDDRLEPGRGKMLERRHRGGRVDDGVFDAVAGELRANVSEVGAWTAVAGLGDAMTSQASRLGEAR